MRRRFLALLCGCSCAASLTGQCTNPWVALDTGIGPAGATSHVVSLATLSNGDLVAAGSFLLTASGWSYLARWDGTSWSDLGIGAAAAVNDLTTLPNGDLVVGGSFFQVNGLLAGGIARWDGTAWSTLGTGVGHVLAVTALPQGHVVAAGYDVLHVWDGTSWTPFGGSMINAYADALLPLPDGDLIVGGNFDVRTSTGTQLRNIARWRGSSWLPVGNGSIWGGPVTALALLPNGDLVAGGDFTAIGGAAANRVARWDGQVWSPLGTGMDNAVLTVAVLPDGDVVAGGAFTTAGGVAANGVARWNGSSWSAFGAGANGGILASTIAANGDLVVGGRLTVAGGIPSTHVAAVTTTCPAAAVATGNGCASSGGANALTATALPWVGGTFRARGTGLPATAIVIAVTSATAIAPGAMPLRSLLPQGVPGCDLLVQPDYFEALLTTTGAAGSQIRVPDAAFLVGASFAHQMVPIELNALGGVVAVTATNALQLTVGMF